MPVLRTCNPSSSFFVGVLEVIAVNLFTFPLNIETSFINETIKNKAIMGEDSGGLEGLSPQIKEKR